MIVPRLLRLLSIPNLALYDMENIVVRVNRGQRWCMVPVQYSAPRHRHPLEDVDRRFKKLAAHGYNTRPGVFSVFIDIANLKDGKTSAYVFKHANLICQT